MSGFEKQICPMTNMRAYFGGGGYCFYYHSDIFGNMRGFENWGISLGYCPVLIGAYLVT